MMRRVQGEALDRKVVWYWRLASLPRAVPMVAMALFIISTMRSERGVDVAAGSVLFGIAGAILLWGVLTAGLRYRRFRFRLSGGLLRVQYGIFIHREKVIPVDRMQHLDVDHGPIERIFGLARLSVFTAGGRGATFQVPGLSRERATALRAEILESR